MGLVQPPLSIEDESIEDESGWGEEAVGWEGATGWVETAGFSALLPARRWRRRFYSYKPDCRE